MRLRTLKPREPQLGATSIRAISTQPRLLTTNARLETLGFRSQRHTRDPEPVMSERGVAISDDSQPRQFTLNTYLYTYLKQRLWLLTSTLM